MTLELGLDDAGLLHARTSVTNTADGDLHLASALTALPVAAHATELLDLTGRWCKERTPQRHRWVQGTHRRDARHGRTGHDATLLMVAGTPGFAFGSGEVWAVHTAWSGNHTPLRRAHARGRLPASAAASCSSRARWCSRRARPTAPPGCSARGPAPASTR